MANNSTAAHRVNDGEPAADRPRPWGHPRPPNSAHSYTGDEVRRHGALAALHRARDLAGGVNELARIAGVKRQQVWMWTTGRKPVSAECAVNIELGTGVAAEELSPLVPWARLPELLLARVRRQRRIYAAVYRRQRRPPPPRVDVAANE